MRLLSLPFLFACSAWVTAQELNTFSNGEVANADKINENFQVLNSALDELTARTCPLDSVRLGAVCVDKYEASVWVTESGALIDALIAVTGVLPPMLSLSLAYIHQTRSHGFKQRLPAAIRARGF